jgi:hypothetical protein
MKEGDEIVSMKYALFDDICLTNLVVKEEDEITHTHTHTHTHTSGVLCLFSSQFQQTLPKS